MTSYIRPHLAPLDALPRGDRFLSYGQSARERRLIEKLHELGERFEPVWWNRVDVLLDLSAKLQRAHIVNMIARDVRQFTRYWCPIPNPPPSRIPDIAPAWRGGRRCRIIEKRAAFPCLRVVVVSPRMASTTATGTHIRRSWFDIPDSRIRSADRNRTG